VDGSGSESCPVAVMNPLDKSDPTHQNMNQSERLWLQLFCNCGPDEGFAVCRMESLVTVMYCSRLLVCAREGSNIFVWRFWTSLTGPNTGALCLAFE
jgi:hypothetical protein